jgi:hypothetical protein
MIVRVSREAVEIVGDDNAVYSTGSLLTLLPQRGEARIARVGGSEHEAQADLLACARDGRLPASLRIVSPGQAPWWDAQFAWPRKTTYFAPPADDSEALVLNPLSRNAWSPPAIISLIRYALLRSSPMGIRWLRWSFTRPKLSVQVGGDFSPVERGEVLDAVEGVWGRPRVLPPPGVSPLPGSPWRLIWWSGPIAVVLTTLYAVSHHWPLWQRVAATLAAASPAFIAKRKEEQLAHSAPRRKAAHLTP